ncbi:MAG: helix-turn-helix domain-containing protein [Candidatus Nanoarchaeia archaeon]|nr:helix-turn-helix domain-containing protein [Candidatus Nanoarchaeia archaeon]MDD5741038.1 helix-turn-helix domain-containing protein [Candidatus Nanoarchaeia archaeon]
MIESLKTLGLTEGEVKVYSAILNLGTATINKIHEKTGLERRTIYDVINKLIEKGFVSYTLQDKRKVYQCSPPNKLFEEARKRQEELKEFEKQIPEIEKIFRSKKPEIKAETFRGEEGIKAVWEDMLNSNAVYWIGSGRYVPKMFPIFFIHWNKRRIKKKVKWFNLLRHEMRKEIEIMPLEYIKFLPKEFSGNPTVTAIYGNKVAQFLFGDFLFVFLIESKELAENYKRYFNYLWKLAKK